jgi:Uma2 family endonuclease
MSVAIKTASSVLIPAESPPPNIHRFSVEQYDRIVDHGGLGPDDRLELLEGWIVDKMLQDPPHAYVTDITRDLLQAVLPKDWKLRDQKPIATPDSRPEPDLAVVRGPLQRYLHQHPAAADIAFVVEVADSTIETDRLRKLRIYARVRIPVYWIINIPERTVEVYAQPKAGKTPSYRQCEIFGRHEAIPVIVEGQEIGRIPVREILPE